MSKRFWIGALAVALAVSLVWGFAQDRRADNLSIVVENQYRRSLADFVTNLDELENNLSKSRAAGTPTQQVYYLSQSWQQSDTAVKDLALLPAEQVGISYLDQFLNQIGEFTRILTQQVARGGKITSDQEKTLKDMHERLITVNRKVQELYVRANTENLAWVDKAPRQSSLLGRPRVAKASAEGQEGHEVEPGSVRGGLEQLDASLQKLPPFTYEGQTDTHSVPEPLGLPARSVSQEEAKTIAANFLSKIGYPGADPQPSGTSNGPFGSFIWTHQSTVLDVTKRGGVVTIFRDERPLGVRKLDVDQAASKALAALKSLGWNLVITSTEDFGGYIQLDAVSEIQGVRIYPDKVRLSVAKDNGQIIGFDATPYWAYHHPRTFNKKLTLEQAKAKLRPDLKVKESRLAVISKPGRQEAFCYEFRGSVNDEEYLIYINSVDGTEEKIQRIIRTPRGDYLQ